MPHVQKFYMTEDQHKAILKASTPAAHVLGVAQEFESFTAAEAAWQVLADELGFVAHTARPSSDGPRYFTAQVRPS